MASLSTVYLNHATLSVSLKQRGMWQCHPKEGDVGWVYVVFPEPCNEVNIARHTAHTTLPQCSRTMNTSFYTYSHIKMLQLYNTFLCRPNKYLLCDMKRDTQHYVWRQKDTYLSNTEIQPMQSWLFIKLISLLLPCILGLEMLSTDDSVYVTPGYSCK
jgi:hypothetical protein